MKVANMMSKKEREEYNTKPRRKMITNKQSKLLDFINTIYALRSEAPTYTEMMKHMGVESKNAISGLIDYLISYGYLEKTKLGKGNISLTEKGKIDTQPYTICPTCGHLYQPKYKNNL